ncbi:hypothetical protein [Erwinia pyrifoliae]|uniref:Uncharacterized protein n=1 Tax=Erwinia pyrifoliae TaxID=79967 RepID=A0ABY5X720_ERWPY|nr:hypothetical protein [Erwinia pyrifoliae]AUX73811.1 hypothetical protein CPI84_15890 [Erwinia pyrifoliae]MCA8875864.1 hypothetical protein [Erwinia pyrifoliae]MCT2387661.1 hypothetical protein [Erwinia pyrifoliae]MCU8585917.1 hypothetical protein [Erwinia pyrifoliae]UWS28787.1 hypothetical protein NYP81_12675 [Erwinia pyrifoliae]
MTRWCETWDLAEICDRPPDSSLHLSGLADIIVTSPLPRARSSLEKLGKTANRVVALYSELTLLVMPLAFPALPPFIWLPLLRALGLFGYSGKVEFHEQAKQRAAEQLAQHGNVLLMKHGMMNTLISRPPRKLGGRGEQRQTDESPISD